MSAAGEAQARRARRRAIAHATDAQAGGNPATEMEVA